MPFSIVLPEQLDWTTRPHEPGEPARHVAELQGTMNFEHTRGNVWRYEPGARGRRHVHSEQEETFVVLAGSLTMHLGEAPDGREAVDLTRALIPDVVLMDIRMPTLDGIAATREIAADPALARVRIVILTTFELDEYVFDAIRAGATGFLVKDTRPSDLIEAVRVVAAGEALLSPSVTRRLIGSATAKTHVSRAMIKLGARDRAQLVVIAYESGLVRPGWSE